MMTKSCRRMTLTTILFLLYIGAIAGGEAPASEPAPEPKGPEPAILNASEAIRQAFRTRQVAPLSPLLAPSGKVYLSVKLIAAEPGFYSRDQLEALLKQAFAALQTVKFHINIDLSPDASGDRSVVVCPALWGFVTKGVKSEINLRFLLTRQQSQWMIGEIRETR